MSKEPSVKHAAEYRWLRSWSRLKATWPRHWLFKQMRLIVSAKLSTLHTLTYRTPKRHANANNKRSAWCSTSTSTPQRRALSLSMV